MADIKKILQETIEKAKKAKAEEDSVRQKKNDEDRNKILEGIGGDLTKSLEPVLQQLASVSQVNEEQIRNALTEAISINLPQIDTESIANAVRESVSEAFSNLQFPAPVVNVPAPMVNVPEMKMPEMKFPERMSVGLENYSNKTPMPVMMVDTKGNPFQFSFPSGGGGGKSDFLTIKDVRVSIAVVTVNPDGSPVYSSGSALGTVSVSDIFGTVGTNVVNPDGRIKVELPTGASGLTDTELRATAVPVSQLSGASWSTIVNEVFGTTGTNVFNPDNRLKVELPTGSSGLTDTELRATAVPVSQVSGASFSVNATDIFATTATSTVVNPDNRVRVELPATTVTVSSITASSATNIVDSTGVAYSGSNPVPVTGTVAISGTPQIQGTVASDGVDADNPIKIGGQARQTNITPVASGDRVNATFDDLGRQVMRVNQVRDLTLTAYASVTNGTETTLRAGVAGAYLDLTMLKLGNTSDAAVSVDIRAVTAGNIVDTVVVPPYGTAGWSSTSPYPQSDTGNNWTIDMPDITGTTVYATALFSQEV